MIQKNCFTVTILITAISTALLLVMSSPKAKADEIFERVTVSGNYLGVWNYLWKKDDPEKGYRRQFDYAVNLDFEWSLNERITGLAQLQTSTGDGSFGFPGPAVEVTDLSIAVSFPDYHSTLVAGSFDAPFGITTETLTNNADATRNAFLLNSLLYSVLGGDVGTLNAIGLMGTTTHGFFEFSASVFNNLNESSSNADGYFGFTSRGTVKFNDEFKAAGSFIHSQEHLFFKLYGWLADAHWNSRNGLFGKGYYGLLTYDDDKSTTLDDVIIWMGEVGYKTGKWNFAARVSGWHPEDNDGSNSGISDMVPQAGFANRQEVVSLFPKDQNVSRLQAAVGRDIVEGLAIKAEFFRDDYQMPFFGESIDVNGVVLFLQGSF